MNGWWKELADAVVNQAIQDYRQPPSVLKWSYGDGDVRKEVKEFMFSQWFCDLSGLDGEDLFWRMKKIVDAEERAEYAKAA